MALTYSDALSWLFAQTRAGAPRDPERVRRLLDELRLPFPSTNVHVVGTNGKGSVTNMVAGGLSASGKRTGRFVSPHVEDFRERVSVNGVPISEAEVCAFVERVWGRVDAAFFELCVALALEHFNRHGVEVGVFEAGVGARRDATVLLRNVRAVAITNVGLDHQDTLGETVAEIAADKAAAIRVGVPVVTGATGEALNVITSVATKKVSPLYVEGSGDPLFDLPKGVVSSTCYIQNARLAAAVLRLLEVDEQAVTAGLQTPPLPGRLERFVIEGKTVILDGGHNPDAAKALRSSLHCPYILVFGALPKKQGAATLAVLEPHALHTLITPVNGEVNPKLSEGRVLLIAPQAVEQAVKLCPPDACVLITGSLYLAGEVRPYLRERSTS